MALWKTKEQARAEYADMLRRDAEGEIPGGLKPEELFVYNPDNSYNCAECPFNRNCKPATHERRLPCGDQYCDVDAACGMLIN